MTRRVLLGSAGGAAVTSLSGCDDAPDLVSDETVEAMGLQGWQDIRRSSQPAGREFQDVLDRVTARLLAAAGESGADWEVLAFDRPEANAFALPGRKIGVFTGMFDVVSSEDQLAAIVGHEIGHLQAEHSQERMSAQVAKGWALRLVSILLQSNDIVYAAEIAAALGIGVEYGLVLPYSRRQELEADRLGLDLMARAGFRAGAAVELWQRMDAATQSRTPEFLATHPAPQSRIEALRKML